MRAAARKRGFHVLADENTAHWIQIVLRKAVTGCMDSPTKAISHTDSKCVTSQERFRRQDRPRIRDKVHWVPERSSWGLKFKGTSGTEHQFCRENSLSTIVDKRLNSSQFVLRSKNAFGVACAVWNAVDRSRRRRITAPESHLAMGMVPALAISHTKAIGHNSGSDRSEGDSGEES